MAVRCLTPELVEFDARIWTDKKDQGLDINEPLEGVVIPESLKPFEADLVRMHKTAATMTATITAKSTIAVPSTPAITTTMPAEATWSTGGK
jgi:hypothetical protein